MDATQREELEGKIAEHCRAGDFAAAITIALKGYGPEVLGYLHAANKDKHDVGDMFSLYCEHVWRGLPTFRGESSFRTWSYRIAYRALQRVARTGSRRGRREVVMSEVPEVDAIIAQVRTRTLPHLRTEIKQEVARLREALDADDRNLLILRVDRDLPWEEIATILAPDAAGPEELKRTSATLRKRFGRIKAKLRELTKNLDLDA